MDVDVSTIVAISIWATDFGLALVVYYLRGLNKSVDELRKEIITAANALTEVQTLVQNCPFCMRRNDR